MKADELAISVPLAWFKNFSNKFKRLALMIMILITNIGTKNGKN
jgi:hypothetical protein